MKNYLMEYGLALVVFLAIDYVWLRFMGPNFYAAEMGGLLKAEPNLAVAFLFYLMFIAGLVVFVINPGVSNGSLGEALLKGAFFGLVAYSTYDLTNLAIIKGYTVKVAVVDMAWGASVSAAVSLATVWLMRLINPA